MIEYHEQLFILGFVNIHGSNDEEEEGGNNLDLSSWIKSGNENVQGANNEHASQ